MLRAWVAQWSLARNEIVKDEKESIGRERTEKKKVLPQNLTQRRTIVAKQEEDYPSLRSHYMTSRMPSSILIEQITHTQTKSDL